MNKYAVAHINFFDSDLKIVIIDATSEVEALIQGVREIENDEDIDEWLNSLTGKSIEDIKTEFFESDHSVDVKFIR